MLMQATLTLLALPNPDPEAPPGTEGLVSVMGWARWVALGICLVGLMAIGAMMAIRQRRGEGGEQIGAVGYALGGVVLISAAFSLVSFLAT